MVDIEAAADRILEVRARTAGGRSTLAAISGIDASGKGYVSARLVEVLERRGVRVASINIDGWLNLPSIRFSESDPAGHFYRHAIRFEEVFERLVLPLRDRRSLRLEADLLEETATAYHRHTYSFADVDVIALEGIFLLKRELRGHHDLSFWIDCTFDTALERAIARRQEGLPPEETVRAYRSIYFPAQKIHFAADAPRTVATRILVNDPRLASAPGPLPLPAG